MECNGITAVEAIGRANMGTQKGDSLPGSAAESAKARADQRRMGKRQRERTTDGNHGNHGQGPPWINTTPAKTIPTVPIQQGPPAEEGHAETSYQQLQKLKAGILEAGMKLPDELLSTLQTLEEQFIPQPPRVTHKQITSIQKWFAKVDRLQKQITEVDANFKEFKRYLHMNFEEQKEIYLKYRKEVNQQLHEARERLEEAQKQVKEASTHLAMPSNPIYAPEEDETLQLDSEMESEEETGHKAANEADRWAQPQKTDLLFKPKRSQSQTPMMPPNFGGLGPMAKKTKDQEAAEQAEMTNVGD